MFRSPAGRVLAVFLLLGALFGLTVWYGSLGPAPDAGAYPDQKYLAEDYDAYVGERVELTGHVRSVDPVVIAAEHSVDETIRLTVRNAPDDAEVGDNLRVYGVVKPDNTIQASNAFTVPATGLWYTWTISFLAGVWVLLRIIRYWRLNLPQLALERRSSPLRWRGVAWWPTPEHSRGADAGRDRDA